MSMFILPVCFQELARERQENIRLLKAHQDKDDLIGKLKEEIDLLNRVSPAHVTSCSDDIFSVPLCSRVWEASRVVNHHLVF